MSDQQFDIIFRGDIVFGHQLADVKLRLQQLFKADAVKIDALFSGRPVPLKRGLDLASAQKYKDAQNYMKLYADCPYRYFANAQTYLSKGIDSDGTAAPNYSCDRRDQDKSGTISGAWFTPGDIFYGLGISFEPSGTNVRISGLSGSSYMIHSGSGNFTDPKTVTYEVCYFTGSTYAYFHLNSATSLSVIYNSASGTCPGSYGAASGSTYQFER